MRGPEPGAAEVRALRPWGGPQGRPPRILVALQVRPLSQPDAGPSRERRPSSAARPGCRLVPLPAVALVMTRDADAVAARAGSTTDGRGLAATNSSTQPGPGTV